MRHDGIRDFLAGLLSTVQNDVQIEPPLQELKTETAPSVIGNTADQARLDIRLKDSGGPDKMPISMSEAPILCVLLR